MGIIFDLVQAALEITKGWCNRKGLSIIKTTTIVPPFTRKHKIDGLVPYMDRFETVYFGVL